jgi:hypothetical protein
LALLIAGCDTGDASPIVRVDNQTGRTVFVIVGYREPPRIPAPEAKDPLAPGGSETVAFGSAESFPARFRAVTPAGKVIFDRSYTYAHLEALGFRVVME